MHVEIRDDIKRHCCGKAKEHKFISLEFINVMNGICRACRTAFQSLYTWVHFSEVRDINCSLKQKIIFLLKKENGQITVLQGIYLTWHERLIDHITMNTFWVGQLPQITDLSSSKMFTRMTKVLVFPHSGMSLIMSHPDVVPLMQLDNSFSLTRSRGMHCLISRRHYYNFTIIYFYFQLVFIFIFSAFIHSFI